VRVILFNREEINKVIAGFRYKALTAYSDVYAASFHSTAGELEKLTLPFFGERIYDKSNTFKVTTDQFQASFEIEFLNELGVEFINNAIGSYNITHCLPND
jgi:hypothetical protein